MKKKKEYKKPDQNRPDALSEAGADYAGSKIIFFNSFEEENEFTHRSYAALSPEERLAVVTLMRLTAYPYLNTNLDPWGKTIYFD